MSALNKIREPIQNGTAAFGNRLVPQQYIYIVDKLGPARIANGIHRFLSSANHAINELKQEGCWLTTKRMREQDTGIPKI